MDDDKPVPPAAVGILSAIFDWTDEQRAAAEPEPPSNIIVLADYRKKLD